MKLGIYEKALPAQLIWKEKLRLAETSGYNFIEMSVDESDERMLRLDWSSKQRNELRHILEDSPLSIPSLCLSGHRKIPLGSHNADTREKSIDVSKKAIDLAYDLGIRVIQMAGYDVYYEESDALTAQWFVDGLQKSLEYAAEAQIILGMEIMDHPFMNSITKFKNIYDQIPSAWLKVYPDLGNLWAWQPTRVLEELKLCPELIVGMHIKDTRVVTPQFPGLFRDLVLGEGDVNFVEGFRYFKEIGYSGPFLIEMWLGNDEEYRLKEVLEWLKRKMEKANYV